MARRRGPAALSFLLVVIGATIFALSRFVFAMLLRFSVGILFVFTPFFALRRPDVQILLCFPLGQASLALSYLTGSEFTVAAPHDLPLTVQSAGRGDASTFLGTLTTILAVCSSQFFVEVPAQLDRPAT